MSFLKINDPAERDRVVAEFLKRKKNIQQNYLSEKLGDIGQQQELTKLYKPIIDSQSGIAKELGSIKENTIATTNALKALPASSSLKAIQFPFAQYPSIEADDDDDDDDDEPLIYGPVTKKYLQSGLSKNKKLRDTTFGIRSDDEGKKFNINDVPIDIEGDNITVEGKTYVGTEGLLELLTRARPDKLKYDQNDLDDYKEILIATKAMHHSGNPDKPKSGPGYKYNHVVKPLFYAGNTGKGVVVIPQDPNALVEMLKLLMASFRAGNTGARNEIVGICDELLRQGQITKEGYKNFMLEL